MRNEKEISKLLPDGKYMEHGQKLGTNQKEMYPIKHKMVRPLENT